MRGVCQKIGNLRKAASDLNQINLAPTRLVKIRNLGTPCSSFGDNKVALAGYQYSSQKVLYSSQKSFIFFTISFILTSQDLTMPKMSNYFICQIASLQCIAAPLINQLPGIDVLEKFQLKRVTNLENDHKWLCFFSLNCFCLGFDTFLPWTILLSPAFPAIGTKYSKANHLQS